MHVPPFTASLLSLLLLVGAATALPVKQQYDVVKRQAGCEQAGFDPSYCDDLRRASGYGGSSSSSPADTTSQDATSAGGDGTGSDALQQRAPQSAGDGTNGGGSSGGSTADTTGQQDASAGGGDVSYTPDANGLASDGLPAYPPPGHGEGGNLNLDEGYVPP